MYLTLKNTSAYFLSYSVYIENIYNVISRMLLILLTVSQQYYQMTKLPKTVAHSLNNLGKGVN